MRLYLITMGNVLLPQMIPFVMIQHRAIPMISVLSNERIPLSLQSAAGIFLAPDKDQ